jgi:hypothetical protein
MQSAFELDLTENRNRKISSISKYLHAVFASTDAHLDAVEVCKSVVILSIDNQ